VHKRTIHYYQKFTTGNKLEVKKEDTRIRRQVLEGKTLALDYFEVHTSTLEPGKAPHPPHVHADQEELMIVKEGQVKITIAGKSKILGPGSIAFAMPGDEHGIENAGNTQATYLILKYKGKLPNIGTWQTSWRLLHARLERINNQKHRQRLPKRFF
jgi:uncharacterized cupin superfamily protein